MKNFKWQGEPIEAQFGYCKLNQDTITKKWFGYELSLGITLIPAIKITSSIPNKTYDGNDFCFVIANFAGIGYKKISEGGWPNIPHYTFDEDNFIACQEREIYEFDETQFKEIESNRDEWFKNTLTYNEYVRRQNLIEISKKNKDNEKYL